MSYDASITLAMPGDDDEDGPPVLADLGNYTRNVSPMFRHALNEAGPIGAPWTLGALDGMTCAAAAPLLAAAVQVMQRDSAYLRELNPANGWGDYPSALLWLAKIAKACRRFATTPGAVLRIDA